MTTTDPPTGTLSLDAPGDSDEKIIVGAGEKRHIEYEVGLDYLSQPVEIPVTIVNGEKPGARLFLSAAVHGNEINGVKVTQQIANQYDPRDISGALLCLHVVNVPGYKAEERYLPIYDRDLNRSFPGLAGGSEASRMARAIYDQFVSRCDVGLDFHTSTRNKLALMHARADMDHEGVTALIDAFDSELVLAGAGADGSLRRAATEDGIPTATIEMGEEDRFQPLLIERAIDGVRNVMAAYDLLPSADPRDGTFTKVLDHDSEKRWLRADSGGLVEMKWGPLPVIREGETICVVSDHFAKETDRVTAPFDGLLIGILANPRALPGRPLVHLVELEDNEYQAAEATFEEIGFRGQRTFHWMGEMGEDVLEKAEGGNKAESDET